MSEAVEVLVPERSKDAVKRQLGTLPNVQFVAKASRKHVARLLVVSLHDIGERSIEVQRWLDQAWHEHAAVPIVFLRLGGRRSSLPPSLAVLQALALVSKRASSEALDPYVAPDREAVRRLVLAHSRDAKQELIASASLEGDTLNVWSCEPRLYRCPVAEIPALARLSKKQLGNLQVSSSGSRLHWPDGDVDLNLDLIRAVVEPEYRKQAEAAFRQEASRYAEAIRAVREKHGVLQGRIAGLSERQVRRLEHGRTFPRAATVKKLAAAHGLSVDEYLKELARASVTR